MSVCEEAEMDSVGWREGMQSLMLLIPKGRRMHGLGKGCLVQCRFADSYGYLS